MERLIGNLDYQDNTFVFLYGEGLNDRFITKDFREVERRDALWHILKDNDFDCILFYSHTDRIFIFEKDIRSRELIRPNIPQNSAENQSPKENLRFKGPLGKRQLLIRSMEDDQQCQTETEQELPDLSKMDQAHALELMDDLMTNEKNKFRTAIVIDQAQTALENFHLLGPLADKMGRWISKAPLRKKNLCVLIFSMMDLPVKMNDPYQNPIPIPGIATLFIKEMKKKKQTSILRVSGPEKQESLRLLDYFRIMENKDMAWDQREKIAEIISNDSKLVRDWYSILNKPNIKEINIKNISPHLESARGDSSMTWQEELERLIGMKNIKEEVTKIKNNFEDMLEREKNGLRNKNAQAPAYHMALLGNPGTGKTTIAKIMGEIFRDIGVLKSGKVIEANYSDLVSQHVGETAQKTTALLNKARDGVLFIDEAYMLLKEGSSSFGEEAIDTITKRMEDERDRLVVIVAGYPNEMRDFFKKANPGFVGRFPKKNHIKFPDYQPSELLELFDLFMKEEGADIESTPEFREDIEEIITNMYNERDVSTFSNARAMRDFAQNVFAMRATRRNGNHLPVDAPIESTDISSEYTQFLTPPTPDEQKLMAKLNELVGLDDVKEHVKNLRRRLKNKLPREKLGQKDSGWLYPHLVFTGNPGTGKTTVAEIMGEIFSTTGIIRKKDVLPVRAGSLIAGYMGQTAERTREKLEKSLDGVVLIDEAYELTSRGDQGSSYKDEAIGALMKFVDEFTPKNRTVVILAGYPDKMAEFMASNPGLQSRFPNTIHFPDYSTDELIEILCLKSKKMNIELPQETIEKARIFIDRSRELAGENFGNARIIDVLIEKMKDNQDRKYDQSGDEEVLKVFLPEDVPDLSGNSERIAEEDNRPAQGKYKHYDLISKLPMVTKKNSPDDVMDAVGIIRIKSKKGEGTGTGFVVTPHGHILTAYHVIEDIEKVTFQLNGTDEELEMTIAGYDKRSDLAILRLPHGSEYPWIPIAECGYDPLITSKVYVVSYPRGDYYGKEATVSEGIVSSLRNEGTMLQISAAATHGSSGGPVWSEEKNEVIGVLHGGDNDKGSNMNFAINIQFMYILFGEDPFTGISR